MAATLSNGRQLLAQMECESPAELSISDSECSETRGSDFGSRVFSSLGQRSLQYSTQSSVYSLAQHDLEKTRTVARARQTSLFEKLSPKQFSSLHAAEADETRSSLYNAAVSKEITAYAVFGGQGSDGDILADLRSAYNSHAGLLERLVHSASESLQRLANDDRFTDQYPHGFDLAAWIDEETAAPTKATLDAAPISMPLICLAQLVNYRVLGRDLQCSPTDMHAIFSGATGHSQGIVAAAVVASARTWPEFDSKAVEAVTLMQIIGARAAEVFPSMTLPPSIIADCQQHGEGMPTPMLSIRNVPHEDVRKAVSDTNRHLDDIPIEIGLTNGRRAVVVSGPPTSLHALCARLRPSGAGSEQKHAPQQRFLPISAPFHSSYLREALELVTGDVKNIVLRASDLAIPVYDTANGRDLRHLDHKNIIPHLASLILLQPLDWMAASKFDRATTVLDFGPGGTGGAGALVHANKQGTGVHVIFPSLESGDKPEFGYRTNILGTMQPTSAFRSQSWNSTFKPELVSTVPDRTLVNTKFSRLLGLPPIMVAGMTPTSSHVEFVVAVMKAGYHAELAAGGFYNSEALSAAVKNITRSVGPGRGIAINVIYASPLTLAWQIDTLSKLRTEGYPIDSLTIGAGVPSLEVAGEYIQNLNLRYISFKPGSTAAIQQVIAIAKAHPTFPVVLQWTGGRGGGHHSSEDFHQPLADTYARIRECGNLHLVVGSGLGDAVGSYPYLTGQWSETLGYAPMPCDGVMLASRMMVAKEARTSLAAKQAIADASGTSDDDWKQTYQRPAGGVLTVKSEMGEPIHKLATRFVRFWHEMDHTMFKLPKTEMVEQLQLRRNYVIEKLNADCSKVWFGHTATSEAADIGEMTYKELVTRLVDLTYVRHQDRWIHLSFRTLAEDVMTLAQSRFNPASARISISGGPYDAVSTLLDECPAMADKLVTYKDARKFIEMCRRKGQKPVPFVPVLDENFETWFKKDSLWQSEDLDAVIDQDVGRVCILHGPVAARHSKTVNETAKEILDNIHNSHVNMLASHLSRGEEPEVSPVECFGIVTCDTSSTVEPDQVEPQSPGSLSTWNLGASASGTAPSIDEILTSLGGTYNNWRQALCVSKNIVQGSKLAENPMRRLFQPMPGRSVQLYESSDAEASIALFEHTPNGMNKVVEVKSAGDGLIDAHIYEYRAGASEPASLELRYLYQPECPLAPLREVTEGRNDRIKEFYRHIWLTDEPDLGRQSITEPFFSAPATVDGKDIIEFAKCVGGYSKAYTKRRHPITAPMDYAIVLGWKALVMPLMATDLDCDLLRLVHLSNRFEAVDDAAPIRAGDVISATSRVTAIVNNGSGQQVRVEADLIRDGKPVVKITSVFFIRCADGDFPSPFETLDSTPVDVHLASAQDVAVLKSKSWFKADKPAADLQGCTLRFAVHSTLRFDALGAVQGVSAKGEVSFVAPHATPIPIGSVAFDDPTAQHNPVTAYLARHGTQVDAAISLAHPVPMTADGGVHIRAPPSNKPYARVSGDTNPIHSNAALARYAELPGTITHGMRTSAMVRGLVEQWACDADVGMFREFTATFTDMVLPGDDLTVSVEHTAMRKGGKVITVTAAKADTQQTVLLGEAVVEPPKTAYLFTGQGSQHQGMGMDIYAESAPAKAVWDYADQYFLKTYGFSIINIVKKNPKKLTIRFGGAKGRAIRENYMRLKIQTIDKQGKISMGQLFPSIKPESDSYHFAHPEGLLFATQFTQPALTIMEKAIFEDLNARGLVSEHSSFAGHSLGEYAALCSLGGAALTLENLVELTFYRGMSMQAIVERDAQGNSDYSMCAVDPSRVRPGFSGTALNVVVRTIAEVQGSLLEIVNYNIRDKQYVCTGNLGAIACLMQVLDALERDEMDVAAVLQSNDEQSARQHVKKLAEDWTAQNASQGGRPVLERTKAIIPLKGIDVPFHSSFLMPGVDSFRKVLDGAIKSGTVEPLKLNGKYIPNLTARPFEVSREYFSITQERTGSKVLQSVLNQWEDIASRENFTKPVTAVS